MGYINEDTYQCDICGFTGSWDEVDDLHGSLWECESCGNIFCSRCLREAIGEDGYEKVMQDSDLVLCPSCAREV